MQRQLGIPTSAVILRGVLVLATALLATACELAEVTTPAGEDLMVVEAVLRAGEARQEVLLHRTLSGGPVGMPDARVVVRTPDGSDVLLLPRAIDLCASGLSQNRADSLGTNATCYASRPGELDVRPGARYELRVETADGATIRGRTVVPGDFALLRPALGASPGACSLPPRTSLPALWSSSSGAWSYIVGARISGLREVLAGSGIEAPDVLELSAVAVSESDTTLVVPGELGLFERFDSDRELLLVLQDGLPAGVELDLVIAAADRNFVNAVRGGGFNPSGNVRVSSVVGDGIGVFGSLIPHRLSISVEDRPGTLPPCLAG